MCHLFRKTGTLLILSIASSSAFSATTSAVSTTLAGTPATNVSNSPRSNFDGRYIVFESVANDIVGSLSSFQQIIRKDLNTGTSTLVSSTNAGSIATGYNYQADISNSGQRVVFTSYAKNLTSDNVGSYTSVFLKDLNTNQTIWISRPAGGASPEGYSDQPAISGDGNWVAFVSASGNMTSDSAYSGANVYLHQISTQKTFLVSKGISGPANGESLTPAISADGRYVAFSSRANNLVTTPDTNDQYDIFLYDHVTGKTELVSINNYGQLGDKKSSSPSISADGRFVAFHSLAENLDVSYNSSGFHIFLRDRNQNKTQLITQKNGTIADSLSLNARISDNGRFISFISRASNLTTDANSGYDLLVYDRITKNFEILTRNSAGTQIDSTVSFSTDISGNGQIGVFASGAPNLGANNIVNVFARLRDPIPNIAPVAIAGNDYATACTGEMTNLTFNGSASYDLDGYIVDHRWSIDGLNYQGASVNTDLSVGQYSVELLVTDDGNATATDQIQIDIFDNTAPFISAQDIVLEANSSAGALYTYSASSSDNCGGSTVSISPNLNIFPLGTTELTISATDSASNTSTAVKTVTVLDRIAPVFGQLNELVFEAKGTLTSVSIPTPVVDDFFLDYVESDAVGSYALGDHAITWRAQDTSNNQSTATQTLRIVDTTAPTLELGSDLVLEATSRDGTAHIITPVSVADSCQCGQLTLSYAPALSTYPLGTTSVIATVSDQSGNTATDSIKITVVDRVPPTFVATPMDVVTEATAKESVVDLGTAHATDIFETTVSNDAPIAFPLGKTLVTWTAKDSNGNIATHVQTVTVVDTKPPQLVIPANIVVEATGILTTVELGSANAVDVFSTTISNNAPVSFPIGETLVTWQAVDANGNSISLVQKVTVVDTTAPQFDIIQHDDVLWPPRHRLVHVADVTNLNDLVDATPHMEINITSEDTHRHRHKFEIEDWKIVESNGKWEVWVRAEKLRHGHEKRIYTIEATATDKFGNQSSKSADIVVEHDKKHEGKKKNKKKHHENEHSKRDHR
ncbi:MAG: HYR domain-containing protein [Gammaproteobacteria bacterium]|nr:HYR domain-containing protein [Gammaproteobacteria bacterium]